MIVDQSENCLALREASWAPEKSPVCHLEFTCDAKTIAGMPSGRQQKIVARIAQTR